MLLLDLMRLVHDCVERGETHNLCLSPSDHRSEEPRLAFRERAVDVAPVVSSAISPSNQHGRGPKLQGRSEAPYERSDVHCVPLPAKWEDLGTLCKEPDEAVSETVGGLGEVPQEFGSCDVAYDGDMGIRGLHGAIFRERLQGTVVPRLTDDRRERVPLPTH